MWEISEIFVRIHGALARAGKAQAALLLLVLATSCAVLLACLHFTGVECQAESGPGEENAAGSSRPASTLPVAPSLPGKWDLIFNDDYDTNPLTRGYVLKMWGKRGIGAEIDDANNVTAADGILALTAERAGSGFSSGQVHTGGDLRFGGSTPPLFSFKYGYIEARMQMPAAARVWPVFWMMPPPNPDLHDDDGEIDILDNGDGDPSHMCVGSSAHHNKFRRDRILKLKPGFHRIGVDWQSDGITWYVDGKAVMTNKDAATIAQVPEYFILGLQVCDGKQWGPKPGANSKLPDSLKVDYVRVWQRAQ
jgi:beta-glucanase (GH16 family)